MKNYLEQSMTYENYVSLIDGLLLEGRTTGPNQSEMMLHYAKLNRQRMKRLSNTVELTAEGKNAALAAHRPMIWLVITEGWCGDAAQNIPIIEKIAAESVNIETRYILRDENLDLMDQFLTDGARSIPKLAALDAETLEVLGTWGPRPQAAADLYLTLKNAGVEKLTIMEELQRWYNVDKNRSLQAEFAELVPEWTAPRIRAAGSSILGAAFSFGTFL